MKTATIVISRITVAALAALLLIAPVDAHAQEEATGTWIRLDVGPAWIHRPSAEGIAFRASADFQTRVPSILWGFGGTFGTSDDAYLGFLTRGLWMPLQSTPVGPVVDVQVQFFGEPEFAGIAFTTSAGARIQLGNRTRLIAVRQYGRHGRREGPNGWFLGLALDRSLFQGGQ